MSETWPVGTRATLRDGTIIEVAAELEEGCCNGCLFDNNTSGCVAPFYLCECIKTFRTDHVGIIFKKIGHICKTQNSNT